MKLVIQISQLLLSLSILIILHEFGHFFFSKLFKTRVEKFYLFFDPWFSLFKLKRGETEYGIGWLPLGGYVKISGMIDESMDLEQMKQPPQPHEFRSKPSWQRLLIMLGGVMVNLLLGFVIYAFVLFIYGEKYLPNKNITDGLWVTDSLFYESGLRTGDKIVSINGTVPVSFENLLEELLYGGNIVVNRNGSDTTIAWPKDFAGQFADNRIHNQGSVLLPRIPFIISSIPDTSPNVNSGLQPKDIIVGIDSIPIKYVDELIAVLGNYKGKTINVTVDRKGENIDCDVIINDKGKMEISYFPVGYDELERLGYYQFATREFSFLGAIPAGFHKAKERLMSYIRQLGLIFNFETGAYKGIGGFGAIGSLFPPVWDWQYFWEITAFLSLMLAFLNILPIPVLDGGHVAFLVFEMVTGRKPSDKFLEYAQYVGMVLLVFLLLYANGNDIYRGILRWIGN